MSLLRMTCVGVGTVDLKVTGFSTPLRGTMASAQTKTMLQHFPYKADQQNMQLQVVCRNWAEMNTLQNFVRGHHLGALPAAQNPEVDLWWPERGMNHWTGFVKRIQAGDRRFNHVPRATLELLLIDSLLSEKTWTSSLADPFEDMFGSDIGGTRDPRDPIQGPVIPVDPDGNRPGESGAGRQPGGGYAPGDSSGGTF